MVCANLPHAGEPEAVDLQRDLSPVGYAREHGKASLGAVHQVLGPPDPAALLSLAEMVRGVRQGTAQVQSIVEDSIETFCHEHDVRDRRRSTGAMPIVDHEGLVPVSGHVA
jgi:hypothetical protein